MYLTLDSRFYTSGQLLCFTGGLGFLTCQPQYPLRHELLPSFSQPDWPDPWLFFQCDQTAVHHLLVGV